MARRGCDNHFSDASITPLHEMTWDDHYIGTRIPLSMSEGPGSLALVAQASPTPVQIACHQQQGERRMAALEIILSDHKRSVPNVVCAGSHGSAPRWVSVAGRSVMSSPALVRVITRIQPL